MNNDENAYFTFKGYQLNNDSNLTSSMEDYLEMIIRLKENNPSLESTNWPIILMLDPHPPLKW